MDNLEQYIRELRDKKQMWRFYKSKEWMKLKDEVLEEQHFECQECLKLGVVTKADTVHHVQFVKKYPMLALSKHYIYNGKQYRNLIAVCRECHNKLHPEKKKSYKKILNEEKW